MSELWDYEQDAATLLKEISPQILAKLELHLHDPMTVCAGAHEPDGEGSQQ